MLIRLFRIAQNRAGRSPGHLLVSGNHFHDLPIGPVVMPPAVLLKPPAQFLQSLFQLPTFHKKCT